MAEQVNGKSVFSLLEVTTSIRRTISERYRNTYWIKAEMNRLNHYAQKGHCYPELLEKKDGKILAQMRSVLWSSDYERINRKFLSVLNEPLHDGIKILFEASVQFDPVYGLSLQIHDIDPVFTLGDLEREKAETIQRLKAEGLLERNKTLSWPLLPQRIAIISVETSKGYADFTRILQENEAGYRFFHMLFPALLQGEKAIESILFQLRRIQKVMHHFDAVAIIRGGGGDIGLSCYNDYKLSRAVAEFPLPVITGIGHATNETVVELVAFQNAITPTKIAEFLVQRFHSFSVPIDRARDLLQRWPMEFLRTSISNISQQSRYFGSITRNLLQQRQAGLKHLVHVFNRRVQERFNEERRQQHQAIHTLQSQVPFLLQAQREQLSRSTAYIRKDFAARVALWRMSLRQAGVQLEDRTRRGLQEKQKELGVLEKTIHHLDPTQVLKRGFSITLLKGRALTDVASLKAGDQIQTVLYKGTIDSTIHNTSNQQEK